MWLKRQLGHSLDIRECTCIAWGAERLLAAGRATSWAAKAAGWRGGVIVTCGAVLALSEGEDKQNDIKFEHKLLLILETPNK